MNLPAIEWVDAPPPESPNRKGGSASWVMAAVGILSTQPGRWARVNTVQRPGSFHTRFRDNGCECVTRNNPEGRIDIYARYVGEQP